MSRPIKKILIANRGEIAMRIIRAAHDMGIFTTAIYSSSEKDALWVGYGREAISLGSGSIHETYTNIPKIIRLAIQSGADAIHPGYGFLSENYLFAEACAENNITFIGPPANILKLAGDKIASHELVKSLGIEVLPKITGTPAFLLNLARTIDFPVLLKAVAGGGGKGMRLLSDASQLQEMLKIASSEAFLYFADERVYLENYLHQARHIEVQIMGDEHGNIAHLFERECSIQRRHQKVIEEAPAVALPVQTRKAIIDAAVKIAGSLHYINAGTIEFLLDDKGKFYFLEMNPRIQVEHGITELITGIDIVREQISIAEGKPLSEKIKKIHCTGHALEARIYAEDPENELLPSPGLIHYFRPPENTDIRIETAAVSGTMIPADYDPLIAKVMVHAPDRHQAISLMQQAVSDFVITGLPHNLPLLHEILGDEDFFRNEISTTMLDHKMPVYSSLISETRKGMDYVTLAIATALLIINRPLPAAFDSPWTSGYWRNVKQIRFNIENEIIELDYCRTTKDCFEFFHNQKKYTVSELTVDRYKVLFTLNHEARCLYPLPENDGLQRISDGHLEYSIMRFSGYKALEHSGDADWVNEPDNLVLAPQPGTILEINVVVGQHVKRGDNLVTIESMKLENSVLAGRPGYIKKINIKTGDKVKKNEPLMFLQEIINN